MKKYFSVAAAFIVMLCLGGVYAWSIIASELMEKYQFSSTQTQVIFGSLIAIFPVTMIFTGKLGSRVHGRFLGFFSALLFLAGYLIAGLSQGQFIFIFLGIGILSGIATGFGYWVALTIPVQWFPERKGLITGIAAAGFGLGALIFSNISEMIFATGRNVSQLLVIIGITYGIMIFVFSNFIFPRDHNVGLQKLRPSQFLNQAIFRKLFLGIFLGTFAGLLVIGSLKLIGGQYPIRHEILIYGVSLFAVANFMGRLLWGYMSDHIGASLSIFLALLLQASGIFLLDFVLGSDLSYILLSLVIGLGFGGNFVLFAKETAQSFGINHLGTVYPYVFLGYALAGIGGPLSGGILYDLSGTYNHAIFLAGLVSLGGGLLFLFHHLKMKREAHGSAE